MEYIAFETATTLLRGEHSFSSRNDLWDFLSDWEAENYSTEQVESERTALGERLVKTTTTTETGPTTGVELIGYPSNGDVQVKAPSPAMMPEVTEIASLLRDDLEDRFSHPIQTTTTFYYTSQHPVLKFDDLHRWVANGDTNDRGFRYEGFKFAWGGRIYLKDATPDKQLAIVLERINSSIDSLLEFDDCPELETEFFPSDWYGLPAHYHQDPTAIKNAFDSGSCPATEEEHAGEILDRTEFQSLNDIVIATYDLKLAAIWSFKLLSESEQEEFLDTYRGEQSFFGEIANIIESPTDYPDSSDIDDVNPDRDIDALVNDRGEVEMYDYTGYPDGATEGAIWKYYHPDAVFEIIERDDDALLNTILFPEDDEYVVKLTDFTTIDTLVSDTHDPVWVGEVYTDESLDEFVATGPINPDGLEDRIE